MCLSVKETVNICALALKRLYTFVLFKETVHICAVALKRLYIFVL